MSCFSNQQKLYGHNQEYIPKNVDSHPHSDTGNNSEKVLPISKVLIVSIGRALSAPEP